MAKLTKIFVSGLPRSMAEAELDELFSQYGGVHRHPARAQSRVRPEPGFRLCGDGLDAESRLRPTVRGRSSPVN